MWEYGVSHIQGVATLLNGLYTVKATPDDKEIPLQTCKKYIDNPYYMCYNG